MLKKHGVKKGDRVTIYMPMIPEAAYAMLACARIGAIHSVVFGGFSPDALAGRIDDCESTFVITADEGLRGGKPVPLKDNTDKAIEIAAKAACHGRRACWSCAAPAVQSPGRRAATSGTTRKSPRSTPIARRCQMKAEDPLFILYTSGSTGKPKGVLHTTGGYLVYASMTHQYVFDYHDGDIYWCTADVGWVTGHSYIVYGPLANGATTLMFEGVPNYPDQGALLGGHRQAQGQHLLHRADRDPRADGRRRRFRQALVALSRCACSARSASRSIRKPGSGITTSSATTRCPIVDTWWQTETGGIMITPLPGATDLKPGSATRPFFGVKPQLVDGEGKVLEGAADGNLCIIDSWPGQMRTRLWRPRALRADLLLHLQGQVFHRRRLPARRGRLLLDHRPRRRRAQRLRPPSSARPRSNRRSSSHHQGLGSRGRRLSARHQGPGHLLLRHADGGRARRRTRCARSSCSMCAREIGPIASPDKIQFAPGLPKTRSGKIMRRILRKIAEDDFGALGDTSTLADPAVVDDLIANRQNRKAS